MLLSDANLTWMRETQEQAMPGTVVIERRTLSDDGMGGQLESWAAVGTASMRIYPIVRRGASEDVGGAQVLSQTQWFATGPVTVDIREYDRLVYDSRSWEVLRTNNSEMWRTAFRGELEAYNQERRT